jgi:hypothetical protein
MTTATTDVIMNQPGRIQALRRVAESVTGGVAPLIDLYWPYVDGAMASKVLQIQTFPMNRSLTTAIREET